MVKAFLVAQNIGLVYVDNMKLADWLNIRDDDGNPRIRSHFAKRIGVTPAMVTQYAAHRMWPSKEVMRKIKRETKGAVCADDFLAPVK